MSQKQILLPQNEILVYDKDFYNDYGIFVKPIDYPLSSRKIEALLLIAEMQKYFQCNPVRMIDIMFNIELLDMQALAVQRSWICPNTLITATRGFGKSTVIDLELMAKGMAFCNQWSYIASGSGSQAEQTFATLEKLANDNIDTFYGSTGRVFKNEIEIKNAAGDGFSHSSNGFNYSLYNGSFTQTLNSNVDRKRGYRGSVIFDESGFLSDEMMNVYGAFAIVNRSLKTGKDSSGNSIDPIRQRCFPEEIPYYKMYISSASDISTKFYSLYRDFSKKQIMGDPDFCVLHLDCELAFKPTIHGEVIAPLLSRSTVESEMRTNPEKARREYYCIFTRDAGADAVVKRSVITRNEEVRVPELCNPDGKKKYVITYDPARSRDNSAILVGEIYDVETENGLIDTRMRLVNSISLVDVGKKLKTPMQTPDQIEYLKKLIVAYDGGTDNYDNIIGIYIDAGSGGGGVNIGDFLMEDWVDEAGTTHRGLIDKEYSADYVSKFPNAVDKVRLISPAKYKSEMYESLIELMNQDKVSFTAPYDNKGYLTILDVDQDKYEKEKQKILQRLKKEKVDDNEIPFRLQEELDQIQSVKTKTVKLDWQEELALVNMDIMKEELVNMARKKRDSGKDSFDLIPEKANKMHDDRAYTCALACWALMNERRKNITQGKPVNNEELISKLANHIRPARYQ